MCAVLSNTVALTVPGVDQVWVHIPPLLPTHFMPSWSFLIFARLDFLVCEMGVKHPASGGFCKQGKARKASLGVLLA